MQNTKLKQLYNVTVFDYEKIKKRKKNKNSQFQYKNKRTDAIE